MTIGVHESATTLDCSSPKWLRPVIVTQIASGVIFVLTGIFDLTFEGKLSNLGTGIYIGFLVILTSISQLWILKTSPTLYRMNRHQSQQRHRNRRRWSTLSCNIFATLSFTVCTINAPLVSVMSMINGDVFDPMRKSCNSYSNIFDCTVVGGKTNFGAFVCDIILFIVGLCTGYLFSMTSAHFWLRRKIDSSIHTSMVTA